MAKKQKDSNFREFEKKRGTDRVYREYLKRKTADEFSRKLVRNKTDAYRQATEILKTVRAYEYYVKDLESKYKQELIETKKELLKALQTIQRLQKQQIQMARQMEAMRETKTSAREARLKPLYKIADGLNETFERMQKMEEARVRGDDVGESLGKQSHAEKDPYEDLLDYLENAKAPYLSNATKSAVANSVEFRQAFYNRFKQQMSQEEMETLWNKYIGSKPEDFNVDGEQMEEKVNWTYKKKPKK